jgi:O-antigen/teichoic acid export membrane protein
MSEVSALSASGSRPMWQGLLGSSAVIGLGLVAELGCQFARTLVLAHLLNPTEFGLVASVNVLATIVGMATWIGLDRYLVYAPEGDTQRALDVAHALSLLRGFISAATIFAFAVPTAKLIGAGEDWLSFAVVSTTPLLQSAAHLGVVRMQRMGCFWPSALTESGAMLLGLLAAVVAALVAPDHRAIVWGLVAQSLGTVILSHLLARDCRYRVRLAIREVRDALRFGLPLMGNGLALAAVYQADRLLVGAWLGVAAVGLYSLALTLILQPISLLTRLATTVLQPTLSNAWHVDRAGSFHSTVQVFGQSCAALGAAGAIVTLCLGAPMMAFVFGTAYATSDGFFVLMAGIVLCRFSRGAVNLLGLSIGQTSDLMWANLACAISFPVTIAAFKVSPSPDAALLGLLAGELTSFLVAEYRVRRFITSGRGAILRPLAILSTLPILVGGWIIAVDPSIWIRGKIAAVSVLSGLAIALYGARTVRIAG